jgi:hypothetical protein
MRKRMRFLVAGVTVSLLLSGCAPLKTAPDPNLTVIPTATASPVPTIDPNQPLVTGGTDQVQVNVSAQKLTKAKYGCGCHLTAGAPETFPVGAPVILLRIDLAGIYSRVTTTQVVTGLNLAGSKFGGRPDLAVIAAKDGQKQAAALGMAWLPTGLFKDQQTWTVVNQKFSPPFTVAYYLPAGVNELDLVVNVPTQTGVNAIANLTVPLPPAAIAMTVPSAKGGE